MAEAKQNRAGKPKTKRPLEAISVDNADKSKLDFTDPNSCEQLQVSDIEMVFENGTLYANAAMLVKTSAFFKGVLLDSWHSTARNEFHRCVFPMSDPKIGGVRFKEVAIPVLYLAYGDFKSSCEAIRGLFSDVKILDEFLTFADKIIWPSLVGVIHQAVLHREATCPQIYPVLKAHSKYGKLQGLLLNISTARKWCLEEVYFLNLFLTDSVRSYSSDEFKNVTTAEDVDFYLTSIAIREPIPARKLLALKLLFLFNRDTLCDCLDAEIVTSNWTAAEICEAAHWSMLPNHPKLMLKILKAINDSLNPKK